MQSYDSRMTGSQPNQCILLCHSCFHLVATFQMTLIYDFDSIFLSSYKMGSLLHLFTYGSTYMTRDCDAQGRTVEYEPSPSSSPNSKSCALKRPLIERLRDWERAPAAPRVVSAADVPFK